MDGACVKKYCRVIDEPETPLISKHTRRMLSDGKSARTKIGPLVQLAVARSLDGSEHASTYSVSFVF